METICWPGLSRRRRAPRLCATAVVFAHQAGVEDIQSPFARVPTRRCLPPARPRRGNSDTPCVRQRAQPPGRSAATRPLRAAPAHRWRQPEAYWRREPPHPQWLHQQPHVRERSRVTTRSKTCSDGAAGNDNLFRQNALRARQAAFCTLPLRYARVWPCNHGSSVISGLDRHTKGPIYSRHVVRAEWHGPSPLGGKSPILVVELSGSRPAAYSGTPCVSLPPS